MLVCKFGGSSLSSAEQFKKVCAIVRGNPDRRLIVPSAPGKRTEKDEKITDLLYACQSAAADGRAFDALFARIAIRYEDIAAGMGAHAPTVWLEEVYAALKRGVSPMYAASRGEYLCARLLAQCLDMPFVDAAAVIRFREDGTVDRAGTDLRLHEALRGLSCAVIPGFYGADGQGNIRTFSRGGSDVTGALAARAVNADAYENWTDVSGVRMADPRVVPDARWVDVLSYRELSAMSALGANVLHREAVYPVQQAGIATNLRNTNAPSHPGTWILPHAASPGRGILTGVAGQSGCCGIRVTLPAQAPPDAWARMNDALQAVGCACLRAAWEGDSVLALLPVHQMPLPALRERLRALGLGGEISAQENLALVMAVGTQLRETAGAAARLLMETAARGIALRHFAQEDMGFLLAVDEEQMENTIRTVYDTFARE